MEKNGIKITPEASAGTVIYVSVNGVYRGRIIISDIIKESSPEAVRRLHALGIDTAMLTGDTASCADDAAKKTGIDTVYSQLMPEDKVRICTQFAEKGVTAFAGDGINDAPVLACADVGIAMGALGSDAAIEAANAVIMDDDPTKAADAVKIARRTNNIARQNIMIALGVKAAVMILGALGAASMWTAVFADVGVMLIAVCNALRALRPGRR